MKTQCPKCGSSDANEVYEDGHTHCYSCGYHTGTNGKEAEEIDEGLVKGQIKEISSRGLVYGTCQRYNYMIAKDKNGNMCQVANYYNQKGNQVVAQKLRYPDKHFSFLGKPKEAGFYGQHLYPKASHDRIVITEGEIDAMSVAQAFNLKLPVVSLKNGAQSAKKEFQDNLEYLESFREIVVAFDNDEPGKKAVEAVCPLISPGKVFIVNWGDKKDANDYLKEGDTQSIVRCVTKANPYRPDGILTNEQVWEKMNKQEFSIAYSTGLPILDSMLGGGVRKKRLIMLTAGSGIGKSTLAKEMCYHLRTTHNLKIGVMSLEEDVGECALSFIGIHSNLPLSDTPSLSTTEAKRKAFEEAIEDYIYFYDDFGSIESENLLAKIRYMAVALEVDFILLDHISIVVSGSDEADDNERRAIDKLMTNLRQLIQSTGVGVIAITHLKRPEKGKGHEEGARVTLAQLRGSGAIAQLSDVVVGLERNQQNDKTHDQALVRILKSRKGGRTGVADTLAYNPVTGRLLPIKGKRVEHTEGSDNDDF